MVGNLGMAEMGVGVGMVLPEIHVLRVAGSFDVSGHGVSN